MEEIEDSQPMNAPCVTNSDEKTDMNATSISLNGTGDIQEGIYHNYDNLTLTYNVGERPPLILSLSLAVQNVVISFGMNLLASFTIADLACADRNHPIRAQLFCTSVFIVGLTTLVQSVVGIRIPVFQGVSVAFIGPLLSMKTAGIWTCEDEIPTANGNISSNMTLSANMTAPPDTTLSPDTDLVFYRVTQLQGSLMLSGLVTEVFLGGTGLLGYIAPLVGPIPVSVIVLSVGLSLYPVPIFYISSYLPVALCGLVIMVLSVTYFANIYVHMPSTGLRQCRKQDNGQKRRDKIPIFQTFAVLLTVMLTWLLCWVLTANGVFSDNPTQPSYRARTDTRRDLLSLSPWLTIPYPGQFGPPRFHPAIFIVFIASYLSSLIESLGDYMMISKVTGTYPPPRHAINRGILVEGISGILAGAIGAGHATTSYSENTVFIKLTAVASRSVLMVAGILCMLFGVIGKFGAIMSAIPDPAVGSVFVVSMGMLVSIGLSPLQRVNMSSTRNLAVVGISLYVGLICAEWMKINKDTISTGNASADQVLRLILGTQMFVAGVVSVVLDNTVKGSDKERGITTTSFDTSTEGENHLNRTNAVYLVPGVHWLQQRIPFCRHIPFLQVYVPNR